MNYQKEAEVTESPQFHYELVRMRSFESAIAQAIQSLRRLDKIKKTLFYGKTDHNIGPIPKSLTVQKVPTLFNVDIEAEKNVRLDEQIAIRVIHGIFGVATEAGEMLELLFKVVSEGKPFDEIHLSEECGDVLWYIACCLNSIDTNFEQVQAQNIAKLRARYPNKFTEFDAINRNTDNERAVLEKSVALADIDKAEVLIENERTVLKGTVTAHFESKELYDKVIESEKQLQKDIKESYEDFLNRLGVDANAWAVEFIQSTQDNFDEVTGHPIATDLTTVRAWFANAIMRAMDEQRWRSYQEEDLDTSIESRRVYGINIAQLAGFLSARIPELKNLHPEYVYDAVKDYLTASVSVAEKQQESTVDA